MVDSIENIAERSAPVFKKYGFRTVGIFGSRARGDSRADSDVDFVFQGGDRTLGLFEKESAKEELRAILGVDVDLLPSNKIIARMRPSIQRDLRVIYRYAV
jgi:uncharacterized protein